MFDTSGCTDTPGLRETREIREITCVDQPATADVAFLSDDELCQTALELTTAGRALEASRLRVLAELDARNVTDRDHGMRTPN